MIQSGRRDKMLQPQRQDVYKQRGKIAEPAQCSGCGAVFREGRWAWGSAPEGARRIVCPACRRVADRSPAGRVELAGAFFSEHGDEILNLVCNEEAAEKAERPLERLMDITRIDGEALVTTTGVHLARRIGESLRRSYRGTLELRSGAGEDSIRVSWSR